MIWFNNKQKIIFFFSEITLMISFLLYCAPANLLSVSSMWYYVLYCTWYCIHIFNAQKDQAMRKLKSLKMKCDLLLAYYLLLLNGWIDRRFAHGTLWGEMIRSKTRTMEPSIDGKYCAYDRSK
jgi:hypothetical protein